MKNSLKKIACVVLSALLLCVGLPVAAVEKAKEDEPIRILAIGNSYSNNATLYISRIAESMGKKVSATSLYYAGCPIHTHVKFYKENAAEYQIYVDGVNTSGNNLNTMKDVFDRADYDYITIQQGPGPATDFSSFWTEEKPYLTELYDIITEHEPQAEVMIHQTWSFSELDSTMGTKWWTTVYDNSLEMFKLIETAYEQAADKLGLDKDRAIIPVGRAIQLAKDEYGYWDAYNPGYSEKYYAESSIQNAAKHCENGALYTDSVDHLNHRGRYIAACVWLEKILGYDCRTATFYPEGVLTAEECVILRNIAHETVTGEKAYIEGDWRVLPDGDGVEILHYMGTVTNAVGTLTVPATIGGKKVTRVDDTAFKYVEGLKKLVLPDDDTIVYEDGALDKYTVIENLWDGTSVKPTKGSGTEEDPYMIYNGSELYWAVTNENNGVYFKLANDILLNDILVDTEKGEVSVAENSHEWYTGGANKNVVFKGVIDGDFHVIRGLYIDEDFNNTESVWNIGAGLIARAGNGVKIENLGIENSYIKAIGGTASAFVGTNGSESVDISFSNCYIGEDVYLYGDQAGGFIGAGNGSGLVSGISNCYSFASIEAESFSGAILGGVWGGLNCPITNCYATMKLHGQGDKSYTDCYAPEKKNSYDKVTVVSVNDMKGQSAMTKLAGLSDAYTLPDNDFPELKAWCQKDDNVWSGFVADALTGEGTEESPYIITNGEELAFAILSGGNGKYYKLNNDIYLNDINLVNWETAEPVGNYVPSSWLEGVTFTGHFDGDGHIVHGIYYPSGNGMELSIASYAALIPQITKNTHVINVGVKNSRIEIFGHAAGIVGNIKRDDNNVNILIDSCFTDNTVYVSHTQLYESTGVSSSGIIGGTLFTPNVKISNCYSLANLSGPYSKSKIVGSTWMVPTTFVVENCYGNGRLWSCSSTGNAMKTAINCYTNVAPDNAAYTTWTQLTDAQMQGLNVFDKMPLGDKYVATAGYPVLKVFIKSANEVILGDVDGDGKVDTTDLAVLKLYLAGVSGEISEGADMDENGEINTGDLAALKLYLAGN